MQIVSFLPLKKLKGRVWWRRAAVMTGGMTVDGSVMLCRQQNETLWPKCHWSNILTDARVHVWIELPLLYS